MRPGEDRPDFTALLAARRPAMQQALERVLKRIRVLSWRLQHPTELDGRLKSVASIASKMISRQVSFQQILDVIGIRAVTRTTPECYELARYIQATFPLVEGTFDDYIKDPKPSGYRSLHTTIVSAAGFPVEIQIRTRAMHAQADTGTARHARYKQRRLSRSLPAMLSSGVQETAS